MRRVSGARDDRDAASPERGDPLGPYLRHERVAFSADDEEWLPDCRQLRLRPVPERGTCGHDKPTWPEPRVVAGDDREQRRRLARAVDQKPCAVPEPRAVRRIHRRTDENERRGELRSARAKVDRKLTPERVGDQRHAPEAFGLNERSEKVCERFDPRHVPRAAARSPAGKLGDEHTPPLRQLLRERHEVTRRDADPVHEHARRSSACAGLEKVKPLAGRVDVARAHRRIVAPDAAFYAAVVPEGDSLARAARRLEALVGDRVEVEAPHPRAAVKRIAERLDGRRLLAVEAAGKNLLLRFEDDVVLRSHLRMSGRWTVRPKGARLVGRPWLVLRGAEREAVLWHGPVLELDDRAVRRLGPDILAEPPNLEMMLSNLRSNRDREIGEALLDQRLVAGVGNLWKAESLWEARISPWRRVRELNDGELRSVLEAAHQLMSASAETRSERRSVYKRAGRACRRCGTRIRSRGQGDANRTAYWCPRCQEGEAGRSAYG